MDEMLTIDVPYFARLSDYLGCWSMDPLYFRGLARSLTSFDLKAHVAHGAEPLKSAMTFEAAANGKQIAIVPLTGILMKGNSSLGGTSTVQARRDIRQAASNPDVAGILLRVDSPGGTVSGTYDLAMDVRAANRVKPVYAHVEDLCASAAFWVASQASRITVNAPTALVGSIGTIQVIYDESAALEDAGVRTLVVATGPLKGLGTSGAKVSDDQLNHVTALVTGAQTSFDEAVRRGRNMSAKELADVRHGGVLLADDAVTAKLVDAVQPLAKTFKELQAAVTGETTTTRKAAVLPMRQMVSLPMLQNQWDGTRKQA